MFNLRECMIFHTDFAEDFFQYPFDKPIEFKLKNDCFESEKVDVQSIFEYCKKKYNYKNDEIHYFENATFVEKLNQYNIYFDLTNYKFIIPIENIEYESNIVSFGKLSDSYIEKLKFNKTFSFYL